MMNFLSLFYSSFVSHFFITIPRLSTKKGKKEKTEPDVIRTRNLLIWSQTRYRCAIHPIDNALPSTQRTNRSASIACSGQLEFVRHGAYATTRSKPVAIGTARAVGQKRE